MSKINTLRIVNLNYNNNSIKISDEAFQFNGESTLMSLRNGGRKDSAGADDDGTICA